MKMICFVFIETLSEKPKIVKLMATSTWIKMDAITVQDHSHDNKNFEPYNNIKESEVFLSSFGKKGWKVGEFQDIKDVRAIPNGRLLITDHINSRIQICNTSGRGMTVYTGDDVIQPWSSVLTREQNVVFTSCHERCVVVLNSEGEKISEFGRTLFMRPNGIVIDGKGRIIVTDALSNRVSMHDSGGQFIRYLGDNETGQQKLSKPQYVCISTTSDILVADAGSHSIKIYNTNGQFIKSFGGFGKDSRQFKCPHGICTNAEGEIFVADHYNNRISVFSRDGNFIRHIVTSEEGLVHPQGVSIDEENHLYVSHGHLKASEILTFRISKTEQIVFENVINHV